MICTSSTSGEHWFFDIAGNRVKCEFCQVIIERPTNLNSNVRHGSSAEPIPGAGGSVKTGSQFDGEAK